MSAEDRDRIVYDAENFAIEYDGIAYPAGVLSEADKAHCILRGFALWIKAQKDPQEAYLAVKSGEKTIRRLPTAAKVDPLREAGAIVYAAQVVKDAKIKAAPGKKLRDTAEFLAALVEGRKITAAWTKAELAQAKKHPGVVAELHTLNGGDLGALFAPKIEAEGSEKAATEAEAA